MLLFLIFILLSISNARKCCPSCTCSNRCQAPSVHASLNQSGLLVHCPDAECACVTDELDTCTYGQVWQNVTSVRWDDSRWHKCIKLTSTDPLEATAMIRWWRNKCMGHIILRIKIDLLPVIRDLFVDFNVLAFFEHDTIHNKYVIRTESGSEDDRPLAGSSEMFFEAKLDSNHTGVHVEITDCTVQLVEGKSANAPVINEYNVFDSDNLHASENGQRMTYTAFWDEQSNSPFQRLVCKYAIYNGTTSENIIHHTVNRTYMMADPNEKGILINDHDDVIGYGNV